MNDTIVAIATQVGESSINVIRLSGNNSINIVNKVFSKNIEKAQSHTITYGFIMDNKTKIDEVLIFIFKSPKSFTTEDVVEISCHGGISSVNKIMELILNNGARLAEPGEFLKRAFLNGRIDLVEAESVSDIINAKTEGARKMAMKGIDKKLSLLVNSIKEKLLSLIANIEVNIDYPEYEDALVITNKLVNKEMSNIKSQIEKLLDDSTKGEIVKNGINLLIVGKPNVGKSSILNKLIGEDKAIVTNIKGTTRDIVEGSFMLDGIIVNVFDTAGIRKTKDVVEAIGVEKSIKKIEEADMILFVVDSQTGFTNEDLEILEKVKDKNVIVIQNKIDLNPNNSVIIEKQDIIKISSYNNNDINLIKDKIKEVFNIDRISNNDYTYISNARQISLLKQCLIAVGDIEKSLEREMPIDMVEIDIRVLYELLGEITGNTCKEELLDEIFSKFCLGK